MGLRKAPYYAWLIVSTALFIILHYFLGRFNGNAPGPSDGVPMLICFGILFLLSIWAWNQSGDDIRPGLLAGYIFRIALFAGIPGLSDDFYRYFWDADLLLSGTNPFSVLPSELHSTGFDGHYFHGVFGSMNSPDYYSAYPPVSQLIFSISSLLSSGNLFQGVIVYRIMIIAAETGILFFLSRLFEKWGIKKRNILLWFLNPLAIMEFTGNLHTEVFMGLFLVAFIYFLTNEKWLLASLFLSLAIGVKLFPVLALLFLVKRVPFAKFQVVLGYTFVFCIALFLPFFHDPDYVRNLLSSLQLYFRTFEFNANIYNLGHWILGDLHYWTNRIAPWFVVGGMLLYAFRDKINNLNALPAALLFAFGLYQGTAPVIHPWYIAGLLPLAVLTRFRFVMLWTWLFTLTYLFYFYPGVKEPPWILWTEYIVLGVFLWYELSVARNDGSLDQWVYRNPFLKRVVALTIPGRVRIKKDRIAACLEKGKKILDVGTGNGGLAHALMKDGFDLTTVDVKDISFFRDVKPQVYDGRSLPYKKDSYDYVMLITVLHHIGEPEAVLAEAKRVSAGKIIVMEDIYRNLFQKHLTFFTDSLINLEFKGHPHTNKTDLEWKSVFKQMGLELVSENEFRTLLFFRQKIYTLEKQNITPLIRTGREETMPD